MQKYHFLLLKNFKNTESAQLCSICTKKMCMNMQQCNIQVNLWSFQGGLTYYEELEIYPTPTEEIEKLHFGHIMAPMIFWGLCMFLSLLVFACEMAQKGNMKTEPSLISKKQKQK